MMDNTNSSLGEVWMQVRDHRKLARLAVIQGVSHRDLAAACGWKNHSYIGRIMRGEVRTVTTDTATRIALVFGVAVDDLFLAKSSKNPRHADQEDAA